MTADGREDLSHYTYLNAHGYLDKFREKLGMPYLTIPMLAAVLKEFKNRTRLGDFIVKNRQGKPCLYLKSVLNRILGITDDGHTITKPEVNGELQYLHKIFDEWAEKEISKKDEIEKYENEPVSYANDEEDMQKVSDKLIHDDNYGQIAEGRKKVVKNDEGEIVPEKCDKCGGKVGVYIQGEPIYKCSKCGKYFGTVPFHLKEGKTRRIFITESQLNTLKSKLSESFFVETEKVKIVKKFLDDNFTKGVLPAIGEDGYGKPLWIVAMKIPFSQEPKNMTATQAFYLLQDKFKKIYSDPNQRDKFLKRVLIDWYNGKISNTGLLSRNNY